MKSIYNKLVKQQKIIFIIIFLQFSFFCFSQNEFGRYPKQFQQALALKERHKKYVENRIIDNLQAIKKFNEALKYYNDEFLDALTLLLIGETYVDLGLDEAFYVDNIHLFKDYVIDNDPLVRYFKDKKSQRYNSISDAYTYRDPIFWDKAYNYLSWVKSNAIDDDIINRADEWLDYIEMNMSEYKSAIRKQHRLSREKKQLENKLKHEVDMLSDYTPFFLLSVGHGFTYGDIGVRASFYKAPNGFVLLGGIGTEQIKTDLPAENRWIAGFGYGFANTGKAQLHTHFLFGNYWFEETGGSYETALNISMNLNVIIYKRLGIHIDGGFWTPPLNYQYLDFIKWGWSAGIYLKL